LGHAKTFENSTTELKNTMRCRYWVVRLSVSVCVMPLVDRAFVSHCTFPFDVSQAIGLVIAIILVVVLVLYFMHKF
jgi:heme/copper-type cytochrome/quinol oxidase subunit 4